MEVCYGGGMAYVPQQDKVFPQKTTMAHSKLLFSTKKKTPEAIFCLDRLSSVLSLGYNILKLNAHLLSQSFLINSDRLQLLMPFIELKFIESLKPYISKRIC